MNGKSVPGRIRWTSQPSVISLQKKCKAEKGVAIGIINSSWGGTNIASWSTRQSLEKYARFREKLQSPQYFHPDYPDSVKNAQNEQVNQWHQTAIGK